MVFLVLQACKKYQDDDKCVPQCPVRYIHGKSRKPELNPDFKYQYNGQCLSNCSMFKFTMIKN